MTEAQKTKVKQYEGMFILDANLGGKHWEKAQDQLKDLLSNHGCEVVRMERWEERKLAYEIKKHRRGVYVLSYFKAPPENLAKLKRNCRLAEWIVREQFLAHDGTVTDEHFKKVRAREKDREDGRPRERRPEGEPVEEERSKEPIVPDAGVGGAVQ